MKKKTAISNNTFNKRMHSFKNRLDEIRKMTLEAHIAFYGSEENYQKEARRVRKIINDRVRIYNENH